MNADGFDDHLFEERNMNLTPELKAKIDELVKNNKVMVFMKGSKLMPECGFSNNVVQVLNTLGATYETYDVLTDPIIRQGIKEYSDWPTICLLYTSPSPRDVP